ncbi:MAG TPA: malto-oligosyltrehalose synthase [Streptosporangiaceae bacterium]|nr:malto-oligosyltrehalose synthase [Streptosporangiaceae bacterium]
MREPPAATYRLQLHAGFGFEQAAATAGYLAGLGVTHLYLSPILQAAPGSMHGYDVVDHSVISADLGGEGGFRALVAELRRLGLGVIVDVVPNHMSIGAPESLNHQFWSVLAGGADSPAAHWFDIDWAARGGRLLLPILGGPPAKCADDLTIDPGGDPRHPDSGPVLRYFGHVLPLRPGTADLPLSELLELQHYELADWRAAAADLNWRRFFDVTTLIGVQVQEADVFAATHEVLLGLVAEGLVDGLRIDHPDGLADPRGYLRQLATATSGCWVVAEKILEGAEQLPADWRCAGTTGYDSLAMVGGLFTDSSGAGPLTSEYLSFGGGPAAFAPVAAAAKRQVAAGSLAAEVSRLARLAPGTAHPALAGADADDLRAVVAELVSAVSVYRAYVVPGEPPPPASVALLTAAAQQARERLPGRLHPALDAIAAIASNPAPGGTDDRDEVRAARAELAVRFQQTCGPVMAKGVEDTAFYRWSRLTGLNEVGGDPGRLGVSPAAFHAFAARLARDWPATMTTLSTHDTKRGEDVRARLAVLAERPAEWAAEVTRWHDLAAALLTSAGGDGGPWPEPDTEYLLWQTLVGTWPADAGRITQYLTKAMREAKTATSWTEPDAAYEDAVCDLARAVIADARLAGQVAAFAARVEPDARSNALGAKLVQLTMPGVPDLYQGSELGWLPLVDPDNRRPVDFGRRRAMLATLDGPAADNPALAGPVLGSTGLAAGLAAGDGDATLLDWQKLLVTSRTLRLRRDHPAWFAGASDPLAAYDPLAAHGPAADHAVAFVRGRHAVTVATRLPAALRHRGGWADTTLLLTHPSDAPDEPAWRDVLTGTVHLGARLPLAQLTERLPVALLIPA